MRLEGAFWDNFPDIDPEKMYSGCCNICGDWDWVYDPGDRESICQGCLDQYFDRCDYCGEYYYAGVDYDEKKKLICLNCKKKEG